MHSGYDVAKCWPRLGREEVAGEDTRRLSLQEPAPANAPAGSRTDAGAAEQHRDARRGNADPELSELAFDPQVTPPGVLPGHRKDQPANLRIDSGAPGRAMRPRPLSCHE